MKRYTYILLAALWLPACNDKEELNQVNPNSVVKENFWKTENDVLSGLAATYKYLRSPFRGYWGYKGAQLVNGRGDDFFIRNDSRDMYQLSTYSNTATTSVPADLFAGCYTGIFRANQVIENAPNASMTNELKNQYAAEAKFLRALNYYHLVINFGDVPIHTTVPKDRNAYFVRQSPQAEVWSLIEADLQEAKASLPLTYPAQWTGRATQGAAIGLLGKAYVYQQKWAEAENEFKLLVQADGQPQSPFTYNLLPNYEDNFLKEKDNNVESLFEIENQHVGGVDLSGTENANETQGVTTAQAFAPTEVAGWFQAYPTNKMFQAFQREKTVDGDFDPRMYASIVWNYPGATFYNKPYTQFAKVFDKESRIKKYQNYRDNNEGVMVSEINEKVLRYADMLLLYAETLTMQGKVTEAYPLVNRIRSRAKLADLPTGYTAEQMMTEIRHQRMVEFFREGQRFYDLRRWGLLEQEIKNSDKEGRQFFNLQRHAYFPIPQGELNTNPSIEQSAAWQ